MSRDTYSPALRAFLCVLAATILVLLGISFGAAGALADPTYSIGGTITDASGTGVGGLGIVVTDSTGNAVGAGTTNPDGTYSVPALAPGTFTVSIAGGSGYLPIQSTVTIVSDSVVLNLTDPRYATIAGAITVQSAPVIGIRLAAFDSSSGVEYDANSPTDANGAYSITLPAMSPGYRFEFTNSAGARLAISSYVLGGNSVALSSACALGPSALGQIDLSAADPIALAVELDPDPAVCNPPVASTAPPTPPRNRRLAVTGTMPAPTSTLAPGPAPAPAPAPAVTPRDASSVTATTTLSAGKTTSSILDPASSNAGSMPLWGWLLVIVAIVLLVGGVGFTVARHS